MDLKALTTISKKIKNNKGFTLVELLIVIALIGIISIPVSASLIYGVRLFDSETEVDAVFQDQLSAFTEIKEALRNDPYNVIIVDNSGVTELRIGAVADSTRVYYLTNNDLIRRIGLETTGNPGTTLCDHITTFELANIQRGDKENVTQLRLTLTASVRSREHTLRTEISLRRY